jgi:cytochrome c biogenesis factor
MVRVLGRKKRSLRLFGRSVLHFAIIVTLIGVFFSSAAKVESGDILARPNSTVKTLGLEVELKNFTVFLGEGNVHSMEYRQCIPEFSSMKLDISVRRGGKTWDAELWVKDFTLHGIVSKPLVIPTLSGDIYLRMLHTESVHQSLVNALQGTETFPEDLILTVEKNPLIYLVWVGVAIMSIGVAAPLSREILQSPEPKAEE